jgi:hypothetical protein
MSALAMNEPPPADARGTTARTNATAADDAGTDRHHQKRDGKKISA